MIRDIRAVIDQMSPEELAEERRRMRARCARERTRGSEGVRMLTYRLRMVEARMQQIAAEAAKQTPEAVSYTHLDVYKRQGQRQRFRRLGHVATGMPFLRGVVDLLREDRRVQAAHDDRFIALGPGFYSLPVLE